VAATTAVPDRPPGRADLAIAGALCIALIVVLGVIAVALGVILRPIAIVAGAIGWVLAFALRTPVILLAIRLRGSPERAQPIIVGASGPAEETVRLVVLLAIGRTVSDAVSIGLGWAGIEVLYSLVNGIALMQLATRTDAEADRAKAFLPSQSMLSANAPWWGVVERAWASFLHLGFTLSVAAQPILFIGTAIVHSLTNLGFLRVMRQRGLATAELAGLVVGVIVLGIGIWLAGGLPPS
jgi:hypothetical protein